MLSGKAGSTRRAVWSCEAVTSRRTEPAYGKTLRSRVLQVSVFFLTAEQFKSEAACVSPNQCIRLSVKNHSNKRLTGIITRINGLQQLSMFLQRGRGVTASQGLGRSRVSRTGSSAG